MLGCNDEPAEGDADRSTKTARTAEAVRAERKIRRYLLSRFGHYHRLWKLNYRVRDGNGCDLPDMVTGKYRVRRRRAATKKGVVVIGILLPSFDGQSSPEGDCFRERSIRVVKQSSVSTG